MTAANPLLQDFDLPPYSLIKPEHVEPAVEQILADSRMAIDELLDEHEQSERVRRWVRENALGLVGGVVLGLSLVGGWKWWQGQQQGQREAEATRYETLQGQLKAQDLAKATATGMSRWRTCSTKTWLSTRSGTTSRPWP